MSFWSSASNASAWRGYDYFKQGKVDSYEKVSDGIYKSHIEGSATEPYHTVINMDHPKRSHCDCPFAKDRRVICKHMVALCFTVFPDEVDAFMREVEESEKEAERQEQEHLKELEHYV
ncbi:SWIM zinc finger family protein [Gordonibacter massiliensis (ex Traore et al. 2017)]|uniref:SWIM zinc finger family protein n=1 Tax=Gordonibacter massiliensis (ex Traore et al. 2017) TaxID=1841863 RepID=UPI0021AEA782|nr:SWIM zinc finger family protein [Gordonibacter massiliensis (ex Traore et al. 2017)]